ncbi:MAG TPA: GTPase HflX [Ignavibacteria bacterium]|nr:GTPase HflX [Ignavibacteria bacterium]
MNETAKEIEKTVLVCYSNRRDKKNSHTEDSLDELKFLAETAGAEVVKTFFQENDRYDARFMIGKGKVEEIEQYVMDNKVNLVIFENELAYTQLRNLEQKIKCKIIDKSNLILDIFASNARSAQAKLQVELAQLEYTLPRLTRQWTHLSKQFGGIGTKGPGETQIETDRRMIKTRISLLKERLEKVDEQRKTQSGERIKFFRISLVGYTNVGKSTLLNTLTNANVYVENKLFATLDTSTKALELLVSEDGKKVTKFPKKVLISDTVGFIKNLPHNLIESFKSTLAEVIESDLLLHVVDVSNPNFEEQMEVVKKTLEEIGAKKSIVISVFNKVDLLKDTEIISHLKTEFKDSVFISAEKGLNINSLMEKIKIELNKENTERTLKLKPDEHKKVSMIYKLAEVSKVKYLKNSIKVTFKTNDKNYSKLKTLAEEIIE